MACEVPLLNHRAPFRVHVVAPKTPTDDLACVNVFTTALAMGHCPLLFIKRQLRLSAIVRHGFEYSGFVLGCVVGARTKLHRTIAVIIPLHGLTTYALAVVAWIIACLLKLATNNLANCTFVPFFGGCLLV
jgi:hypothetical protein